MWEFREANSAMTHADVATAQVRLELTALAGLSGSGEVMEREGAGPLRAVLRESLLASEPLKRYARLRKEAESLDASIRAAVATSGRVTAERNEVLELAAPGFSEQVADLDKEAGELATRVSRLKESAAAIRKPTEDARQAAVLVFARASGELHNATLQRLTPLRAAVLARISAALQPLLGDLVGIDRLALACMVQGLAGDSLETVDRLADELLSGTATG